MNELNNRIMKSFEYSDTLLYAERKQNLSEELNTWRLLEILNSRSPLDKLSKAKAVECWRLSHQQIHEELIRKDGDVFKQELVLRWLEQIYDFRPIHTGTIAANLFLSLKNNPYFLGN